LFQQKLFLTKTIWSFRVTEKWIKMKILFLNQVEKDLPCKDKLVLKADLTDGVKLCRSQNLIVVSSSGFQVFQTYFEVQSPAS